MPSAIIAAFVCLTFAVVFTNPVHGFWSKKCGCNDPDAIRLHNWGGNFNFSTQNIQYPRSVAEVQYIVRHARKLRVLGSRHSFSTIADSKCTLLSTLGLNQLIRLNTSVPSVTVGAGIDYEDLAPQLASAGYALANLAALTQITVSGGTQTGSHGSGINIGGLASQVRSLELVTAEGNVVQIGPDDPRLKAIAVGLGAFGVITKMELNLVPIYTIQQYIYANIPTQNLFDNFNTIENSASTVMPITVFSSQDSWNYVIVNVRSNENNANNFSSQFYGATLISQSVQTWYDGLLINNFGLSYTDGDQFQSEYIVPYTNAMPAIQAVLPFFNSTKYTSVAIGMLIRTIKGDDLWMSQFYGNQTMVAIHFSWYNQIDTLRQLLPPIESALLPFGAHPHWGKLFMMSPKDFLPHYPMLEQWKQLAKQMDPYGKFRNKYLDVNVFVPQSQSAISSPAQAAGG